jgi:hypothetical protein
MTTKRELTPAEIQYYAMLRALTPEEQEERAKRQAEGCRALTQEEILEHQLRMMRLYRAE